MTRHGAGTRRSAHKRFPVAALEPHRLGGESHDDMISHRLDDVVQGIVPPEGDYPAGWVRGHAQWRRLEHARHFRIGVRTLADRQIALLCLGSIWLMFLRKNAQNLLAHGPVLVVEGHLD